jgi:hypothetical protein
VDLANQLREHYDRLERLFPDKQGSLPNAYQEESADMTDALRRGHERMQEFVAELNDLSVELKDFQTGLVDFRSVIDDREVYLCWRLGEPQVAYWHELDSGVAGRHKLENCALTTSAAGRRVSALPGPRTQAE